MEFKTKILIKELKENKKYKNKWFGVFKDTPTINILVEDTKEQVINKIKIECYENKQVVEDENEIYNDWYILNTDDYIKQLEEEF